MRSYHCLLVQYPIATIRYPNSLVPIPRRTFNIQAEIRVLVHSVCSSARPCLDLVRAVRRFSTLAKDTDDQLPKYASIFTKGTGLCRKLAHLHDTSVSVPLWRRGSEAVGETNVVGCPIRWIETRGLGSPPNEPIRNER